MRKLWMVFLLSPFGLFGHGENPEVVTGSATFEYPNPETQVIRAADKTAINFRKFNLAVHEKTEFMQPHSKSVVLCRVTGKNPSLLLGKLQANGRILFINPYGIVFGGKAEINVGSLIASTLDIKDRDFEKGKYQFSLRPESQEASIVNRGSITAARGGHVVFMAPQIFNQGLITAEAGKVAFLGGELITLDFSGDKLISFAIEAPLKGGIFEQGGTIKAGQVFLDFKTAHHLIKNVVNVSGLVEAGRIERENGIVRLVGTSTIDAQEVVLTGRLVDLNGNFSSEANVKVDTSDSIKISGNMNVKQLHLKADTIDQIGHVKAKGLVDYTGAIYLGGNIQTVNHNIVFNGPVIRHQTDTVRISSGFGPGDIVFGSTLDADHPSRLLGLSAGQGAVHFQGDIGLQGPLGDLAINSTTASFHNIGETKPGVHKLFVDAKRTVQLHGKSYYAGQQTWNSETFHLTAGNTTHFVTAGLPMVFHSKGTLRLDPNTSVHFKTHGGLLQLLGLIGDHQETVSIQTGHGVATVGDFTGHLGSIKVNGRDVIISGEIEADTIFLEAEHDLHYLEVMTKIKAIGDVTLNAKQGMVGIDTNPIHVETTGHLYVGAKTFAYAEGTCADYPHVYSNNPPPLLTFNGNEYQFLFAKDLFGEESDIVSLAPDLFHKPSESFIDGSALNLRHAPIYYTIQ